MNGEECEVDEKEEVTEEQSPGGEMMADQASSGVEELSLTEQEEEKGEKGNKEEEAEQDDQKMTQGIQYIDSVQQVKETFTSTFGLNQYLASRFKTHYNRYPRSESNETFTTKWLQGRLEDWLGCFSHHMVVFC